MVRVVMEMWVTCSAGDTQHLVVLQQQQQQQRLLVMKVLAKLTLIGGWTICLACQQHSDFAL
jgi:hypothetical protein